MITKIKERLLSFIKLWPELWSVPVSILLFAASIPIIRWIDPTAGVFDWGIFQTVLVTVVILPILSTAAFMGIRFNFKFLFDYYRKTVYIKDYLKLTPWQRLLLFCLVYLSLLLAGVILVAAYL
ncbi:hypothetical protein DN752_17780 [Echinicola strongylocentroti]|uniref:Uncharacterized protein n=1 Tax=Echinicola strongylocentroti TaxID=1795355 RepID=A0A2Z4IL49_9BACT|nr:hypothetical protein [Echinicola strongylocentroti]AWW31831.1 hypothetical protein DN752_17780 [Echinicola strongylocentroti]